MLFLLHLENVMFVYVNNYPLFIFTTVRHNLCLQQLRVSLFLGMCRLSLGICHLSLAMFRSSGTP